MSKKYDLLTFEDFFMNFLLELKFLILSHPVTSKQPLKIVQILLVHPVSKSAGSIMSKFSFVSVMFMQVLSLLRNRRFIPNPKTRLKF